MTALGAGRWPGVVRPAASARAVTVRSAGQRRGPGPEAHLPHRHARLPSVLRRGVARQAGQPPDRAGGRCAEQHGGAAGAGGVPRGRADQAYPRGPAGTLRWRRGRAGGGRSAGPGAAARGQSAAGQQGATGIPGQRWFP